MNEDLIKVLRCELYGDDECDKSDCPIWSELGCRNGIANRAAADALEAAEQRIAELEAQLPKEGEWIEDTTTYAGPCLSNYKCSLCGKICGTWRRGLKPSELPNWCGNCGAKMKVEQE